MLRHESRRPPAERSPSGPAERSTSLMSAFPPPKRGRDDMWDGDSDSDDDGSGASECGTGGGGGTSLKVGDAVIAHHRRHNFYNARIRGYVQSARQFLLSWNDGDLTHVWQPHHLVFRDAPPAADEVGVGSTVLFPQGKYKFTDAITGIEQTGLARYHEGRVTAIEASYPPTDLVFVGEHAHDEADNKWVGYKDYAPTFRCALHELRVCSNVFDLVLNLGSLALGEAKPPAAAAAAARIARAALPALPGAGASTPTSSPWAVPSAIMASSDAAAAAAAAAAAPPPTPSLLSESSSSLERPRSPRAATPSGASAEHVGRPWEWRRERQWRGSGGAGRDARSRRRRRRDECVVGVQLSQRRRGQRP